MNIAIFADNFYPQINGVVISTIHLATGLAQKGHTIIIFAPRYKKIKYPAFHKNISIITVPSIPAPFYQHLKMTPVFNQKILRTIIREKIDIIHFHTPLTLGLQAVIIARILRIPLIGTFHTYFGHSLYLKHAKLDYKFMQHMAWDISNIYYNRCTLVTTPSQTTKRDLLENGCKIPIQVISNGIIQHKKNKTAYNKLHKKYHAKYLLLFVGRLAHEKNIDILCKAMNRIVRENPKTKLLLVGDGPQQDELEKLIQTLDLQEHIILLGSIPHQALMSSGIYGACDLFVIASETETQGLCVLEALAHGTPAIGVQAGALPEIIINKKNGLTVPPQDPIAFAKAVNDTLRNTKKRAGFAFNIAPLLKEHLLPNVINTWEETYQLTIQKSKTQKQTKKTSNQELPFLAKSRLFSPKEKR